MASGTGRAIAVVALLLAACGGATPASSGLVTVAAAFYPLAEAAERIGGNHVQVRDITPPGAEPHAIELSPGQIATVLEADVLLYLGGGFQPAVEDLARRRSGASVNLLSGGDPHVWLDPASWREALGEVAEALTEAAPGLGEDFATNLAAYRAELTVLDADFRAGLRDCRSRVFVTAHDAFGRLAARYELEQIPIAGVSPESEPTPARLAALRDLVKARGVTTIFTEELVSPRVAETLARETGARTATLDPIESLSPASLRDGKTYLSQMLSNLKALRAALGCT